MPISSRDSISRRFVAAKNQPKEAVIAEIAATTGRTEAEVLDVLTGKAVGLYLHLVGTTDDEPWDIVVAVAAVYRMDAQQLHDAIEQHCEFEEA
jgi:predicted transcriptional regulator